MKCKRLWTHFDFKHGGYAPCYRFKTAFFDGGKVPDLPSESFNSESWIRARTQMMAGMFPPECIDCKLQEEEGVESYRMRSLADEPEIPEPDYTTPYAEIYDIEMKLSRACNYRCRHCGPFANSTFEKIGDEHPHLRDRLMNDYDFNHLYKNENIIDIPTEEVIEDLIQNIIPNRVTRIAFSGGEPFYHQRMYTFLEQLIDHPDIDTSRILLTYNTNMSMTRFKKWKLEDLWSHFQRVHITVSMDGTGDLFNYFREGGDYQTVVNNITEILEKSNKIKSLLIACTTTAYHAFYMNEISRDIQDLVNEVKVFYPHVNCHARANFVHWPKALDVVNLAEETKTRLYKETIEDDFTSDFRTRLLSPRTQPEETFKDVVRIQDMIHNRDASTLAPRIFDYVY